LPRQRYSKQADQSDATIVTQHGNKTAVSHSVMTSAVADNDQFYNVKQTGRLQQGMHVARRTVSHTHTHTPMHRHYQSSTKCHGAHIFKIHCRAGMAKLGVTSEKKAG